MAVWTPFNFVRQYALAVEFELCHVKFTFNRSSVGSKHYGDFIQNLQRFRYRFSYAVDMFDIATFSVYIPSVLDAPDFDIPEKCSKFVRVSLTQKSVKYEKL